MRKRLIITFITVIAVIALLIVAVCTVKSQKTANIEKYINGKFFVGTNIQDSDYRYQFIFYKGKVSYQENDPWHKGNLNIEMAEFNAEYRINASPFTSKVSIEILKDGEWEELIRIYTKLNGEIDSVKMNNMGLIFTEIDFSKIENYNPIK